MNVDRREFLLSIFKEGCRIGGIVGGLTALSSLGIGYREAFALYQSSTQGNRNAIEGAVACTTANDSLQFAMTSVSSNTTAVDGTNYRGVTLLEGAAYTITSISVYCVDTSSDTGSIVSELYAYTSPDPTGSVLATVTVACSALPNTAAQYEFAFSVPYNLVVSTDYVITFRGIDGGSMNIYRDTTNSIANSYIIHSYDSGSNWATDANYDLRADGVYGCS
jgi:hypothetical protein